MIKPQINSSHTDFHAVSCFSQTCTQAPHLTRVPSGPRGCGNSFPTSHAPWTRSSLVLDRMSFVCCEFLFPWLFIKERIERLPILQSSVSNQMLQSQVNECEGRSPYDKRWFGNILKMCDRYSWFKWVKIIFMHFIL